MTYRIKLDFAAAHSLPNYGGVCRNLHGHTWKVEFYIAVPDKRDASGIGIDFKVLKERLEQILPDHKYLNEVYGGLPSAENIIEKIYSAASIMLLEWKIGIRKVVLWETEKNGVELEVEG